MSITFGGAVRAVDTSTASASKDVVLASDVPAGATIVVGIFNRTNETATLDSVSDPVNGTWTLGTVLRQGPSDNAASTGRTWYVALTNSAALTGAANRTITVTTSAGVSTQLVALWASSDAGAMTFQAMATLVNPGSNTTDWTSATNGNTVAGSGAGCIVGFSGWANGQTIPNPSGGGETQQTTVSDAGSYRANLWTETYASSGTYGFEVTAPSTTTGLFHVGGFLEPAAGATLRGRNAFRSPMFNSRAVS
jgi:plastocyanin